MTSSVQEDTDTALLSLADVGVWLSLLAALAIPVYSLGLIALTAQIAFTYSLDYSTAWYAASLVPNKVVLGQGLRVVVVQPWYFLIILPSTVHNMWGVYRSSGRLVEARMEVAKIAGVREQLDARGHDDELGRQMQASLDRLKEMVEESPRSRMPQGLIKWVGLLVVVMLLALMVLALVARDWSTTAGLLTTFVTTGTFLYVGTVFARRRIPFRWALPIAFLVVYAGAVLIAAVSAGLSEPPLPLVKISAQPPRQGQLLTHADGYWHILTEGSLVVVPDCGVTFVTVTPAP